MIADFKIGEDKIELNFDGINSIADLQFIESTTEPGINLKIGNHGSIFLRGTMEIDDLNVAGNFVFL